MAEDTVTIRLPRTLCEALAGLARFAGSCEDPEVRYEACEALGRAFRAAAGKNAVTLDDAEALRRCGRPPDGPEDAGRWDRERVNAFYDAFLAEESDG